MTSFIYELKDKVIEWYYALKDGAVWAWNRLPLTTIVGVGAGVVGLMLGLAINPAPLPPPVTPVAECVILKDPEPPKAEKAPEKKAKAAKPAPKKKVEEEKPWWKS